MLELFTYMYLAVDIGGTKTLVATFDENGKLIESVKFPTSNEYQGLLKDIESHADKLNSVGEIKSVGVAVPVPIDYKTGISKLEHKFNWAEVDILKDLNQIFDSPVSLENDANLAALGEAVLGSGKNYQTVLYITISTGIGTGVASGGKLDRVLGSTEGGLTYLFFDGKEQIWEDFASGKAFFDRYNALGSEIEDPKIWNEYSKVLAAGFVNLINIINPDVVVVGGGMGAHFHKYESFLLEKMRALNNGLNARDLPPVVVAQRPDEAVIYGCYLLAKNSADK